MNGSPYRIQGIGFIGGGATQSFAATIPRSATGTVYLVLVTWWDRVRIPILTL